MYNLILRQNTRDKLRMPEMFCSSTEKDDFPFPPYSAVVTFNLTGGLCYYVRGLNLFDVETFLKMIFIKPFCLFPGLSTKRLKRSQNVITIKILYFMMFFLSIN